MGEWRAATPTWRRTVLFWIAVLLALAGTFLVGTTLRAALGEDDDLAEAAGWGPPLVSIAFPLALLVVQSRARLFAAGSLRDMVGHLSPGASRGDLEATIAAALGDPSLRLVFWVPHAGYVGISGAPGRRVRPRLDADRDPQRRRGSSRRSCTTRSSSSRVPGVVEDAGAAVLLALENARLEAEVRTTERELRESRARILAAGMSKRGGWSATSTTPPSNAWSCCALKLDLADQQRAMPPTDVHALLERLGDEVDATISGLRQVGRGLYPRCSASRGSPPRCAPSCGPTAARRSSRATWAAAAPSWRPPST